MSKEIKIIQCSRCNRELYRQEKGNIDNANGIKGSNTEFYRIDPCNCPACSGKR